MKGCKSSYFLHNTLYKIFLNCNYEMTSWIPIILWSQQTMQRNKKPLYIIVPEPLKEYQTHTPMFLSLQHYETVLLTH